MASAHGNKNGFVDGCIDFTGGSLGGVALVLVGQPLDTVKVKMQAFPNLYSGMTNCIKKTVKRDGFIRGLYAGTTPALIANVAENSVLFAGYGACQKLMAFLTGQNDVSKLSTFSNASAGCLAAFFSSFTLCPTELVKCQLQAIEEAQIQKASGGQVERIGPVKLTRQIVAQHGFRGLFVGLGATIAREMPGYFFFFGGYELTRELFRKPNETKDDIGWVKTMIAGAVGGCVLWTVIFPADVIKSRVQISGCKDSMFKVGMDIAKKDGMCSNAFNISSKIDNIIMLFRYCCFI
uniref:Putative mitochondrial carrier protein n=1 Tax=Xenopsylla cheopis TaxID=163159 RepID=A0A6M2DHE9_XENCH